MSFCVLQNPTKCMMQRYSLSRTFPPYISCFMRASQMWNKVWHKEVMPLNVLTGIWLMLVNQLVVVHWFAFSALTLLVEQ